MKKHNIVEELIQIIFVCVFMGLTGYFTGLLYEHNWVKKENIYPLSGVINEIDYKKNYVVIEDFTENLWIWGDAEDWARQDFVIMIMDSKGTESILDDEIIKMYHDGWVE